MSTCHNLINSKLFATHEESNFTIESDFVQSLLLRGKGGGGMKKVQYFLSHNECVEFIETLYIFTVKSHISPFSLFPL